MRSIVAVTSAATKTALTTRERVKGELSITVGDFDDLLDARIAAASSAIKAYLGFTLAQETVTETFRLDPYEDTERLSLKRTPVSAVSSVVQDDDTVDPSEYELDADSGLLYRLDCAGYRWIWLSCKSIIVAYTAGYLLPDQENPTLPPAIEQATVKLVSAMHLAAGRDPMIKSENIPGVMAAEYWIGGVGDNGALTPDVKDLLAPYKRAF